MDNYSDVIDGLMKKFNPSAAIGKNLLFQFVIEGDSTYYLKVEEGTCDILAQIDEASDVTLTLSKEDLKLMLNKELNTMTALMTGRLKIDGNPLLAMQLSQLFSI